MFDRSILAVLSSLVVVIFCIQEISADGSEALNKADKSVERIRRSDDYVRLGRSGDKAEAMDKRDDYVRLGRSSNDLSDNTDDQIIRNIRDDYVRFGRSFDPNVVQEEEINQELEQLIIAALHNEEEEEYTKRGADYVRMGRSFEDNLEKRANRNFIRMGKRSMEYPMKKARNYIRMGRAGKGSRNLIRMGRSSSDLLDGEAEKRARNYIRMGRSDAMSYQNLLQNEDAFSQEEKRKNDKSFVRMGKSVSEDDYATKFVGRNLLSVEENSDSEMEKRKGKSFIRMGKSVKEENQVKGNSSVEKEENADAPEKADEKNDVVIIKDSPSDAVVAEEKRGKSTRDFVRMGRDSDFVRMGRYSDFVRMGRGDSDFVRMGRGDSDFVRMGRGDSDFVRMGRGDSDFVRMGRGDSDFVRMGRGDESAELTAEELDGLVKRASKSFVRMGKSISSPEAEKRAKLYIRMGKSVDDTEEDKRTDYVRMGRMSDSGFSDESELKSLEDKRGSNRHYVRFGKR